MIDGLCLDKEEVVVRIQYPVLAVVAPRCRSVLDAHILTGVILDIRAYAVLPGAYACGAGIVVKELLRAAAQFKEGVIIYLAEILKLQQSVYQQVAVISPVERILTAGVALIAAIAGSAKGVVVVVRDEEELVAELVLGIEVEIIVVLVVPIVIPHSHSHVDGVCLEKQLDVTDLLDPVVETIITFARQLEDEVLELGLRSRVVRRLRLQFVGPVAAIVSE